MPMAEQAASPASAATSTEACLSTFIAEAAVVVEAMEALEAPVMQESGIDLTLAVAAELGTTEEQDDAAADIVGTGDDKLRFMREWETAWAEDQEGTVVTVEAIEDTGTASFVAEEETDGEAGVNEGDDITIGMPALKIENIILNEAIDAIELSFLGNSGSEDEMEPANEGTVEDADHSQSESVSQRAAMPMAEQAASPASAATSTEACLSTFIAEAAVVVEAMEALEAPVMQESGIDLTLAVAAELGTTEEQDDAAADIVGTGDDKLRFMREWETAWAEDQEGTVVTVEAIEDTGTASFVAEEETDGEAGVNEGDDITIGMPALKIENIILKEAADAIKEAMQAAENLVEQDAGEYGDGSSEGSEIFFLEVTKMGPADNNDNEAEEEEEEEEESSVDNEEEHKLVDLVSYCTLVSREEDEEEATIGAIISAASSDGYDSADQSIDSSQKQDEDEAVIGAYISTPVSDDDGIDDESFDALLRLPSSVE